MPRQLRRFSSKNNRRTSAAEK